MSIKVR